MARSLAGLSGAIIYALAVTVASLQLQTSLPDTAYIRGFYAGTGNQFAQLINALYFAEVMGLRGVTLPETFPTFFDHHNKLLKKHPPYIAVAPNPQVRASTNCSQRLPAGNAGTFAEPVCDVVRKKDYRRLMLKYVKPLLNDQMRGLCDAKVKEGFDGLTIHLRSGDVLRTSAAPNGRFAPCSFFDKVIQDHNFRKVLVVAQDMQHPCIEAIQARHRDINVTVQSSYVDDICAVMTARNLAWGTFSTFSMTFELLNDRLERNFKPGACQCVARGRQTLHKGPQTFCYNVDGMGKDPDRAAEEKYHWMLRTGTQAVKLNGTCNEEDDAPYQGAYGGKHGVILQIGGGAQ